MQVNVLVLEGPPQSLDENVVLAAASTIHADGDLIILEHLGESVAGKLSTLVGVENIRRTITAQGFFKSIDTKGRLHGYWRP
ncbi:hypothetical protein [uncultured Desulfosarcina sp.]|uniref:hypothetical protein n=1 Tax=uncultured Desulfosarcina sp. TaxID=218289 RepID=UPI00374872E2